MGIMPVDRELKWQRIFRRFGLPGSKPEREETPRQGERDIEETAPGPPAGKKGAPSKPA